MVCTAMSCGCRRDAPWKAAGVSVTDIYPRLSALMGPRGLAGVVCGPSTADGLVHGHATTTDGGSEGRLAHGAGAAI